MKLTKTLGLGLLGSSLLVFSCKKDDAPGQTPVCKVDKAVYYAPNATTPSNSATYFYTGNKVSKLNVEGDELVFEYTGDKISKRSFVVSGSASPEGYEQIAYNSDGTISRIESFGYFQDAGFQAYERVDFAYTSGRLSRLSTYDLTSGTAKKILEHTYTYSGNNISRVDETDHSMGNPATYSYNYTYDSQPNYYQKQNAQSLLIDPFLGGVDGAFLPLFNSANNVTAISSNDGSISIGYTLDDRQNLKEVALNVPLSGQIRVSYSNLCP